MSPRLADIAGIAAGAARPEYDPAAHACGIVHFGVGAFHRAHQAFYTDRALAAEGGDWRIAGLSLRGTAAADALNPQNGLYTLLERGPAGLAARVIASIDRVVSATREPGEPLRLLADPAIRIVTLTVTEKAYGIVRSTLAADSGHPAVAADLADPRNPAGVLGLLSEGLRLRRDLGLAPFTVLCCDNLPENGAMLRAGVLDFARRTDPPLAAWIESRTAFPSCMVDRITPASTEATMADARRLTGCVDFAAVETEPFTQWVIEDSFPAGRPGWEAAGALFVDDVRPYEQMKLRMLNGSHSMLAYAGFLCGMRLVRDVMADRHLRRLVDAHLAASAATLRPLPGMDLGRYRQDLVDRFANPAIAHETYQIAMDGTQKLPQRILAPALDCLAARGNIAPFAFAAAAWMRYCLGRTDDGVAYALRDPREAEIRDRLAGVGTAAGICDALLSLDDLFDRRLADSREWRAAVNESLAAMLRDGCRVAVAAAARGLEGSPS